jgi:UDP-N-acetylglucosamine---dolichyl-phosphate N-acetylglucosaminyltransferase
MSKPKLLIILPAYNEASIIAKVLQKIKKEASKIHNIRFKIVVVDDGSRDDTSKIAKKEKVLVLRHFLNRGLGAALKTGLTYAKKHDFDFALTMDSDGQHEPKDIKKALMLLLKNQADVVIGSRMLGQHGMPLDRKIINFLSSLVTYFFFQIWTTDSQSGFRAFNQRALKLIKLKTQGMEVSSEFFSEIKINNLYLKEIPIKVIYSKYSKAKGQSNLNSLPIITKLFYRVFR